MTTEIDNIAEMLAKRDAERQRKEDEFTANQYGMTYEQYIVYKRKKLEKDRKYWSRKSLSDKNFDEDDLKPDAWVKKYNPDD